MMGTVMLKVNLEDSQFKYKVQNIKYINFFYKHQYSNMKLVSDECKIVVE